MLNILNLISAIWCLFFHLSEHEKQKLDNNEYVLCKKCLREYKKD